MSSPSKPFLCKTNLHHHWEWAHTSDRQRYVRCARCHKERDSGSTTTGTVGAMMGGGGGGG
jgi:hypothetical protein